jgi:hypothetical protein
MLQAAAVGRAMHRESEKYLHIASAVSAIMPLESWKETDDG